MNNTTKVRIVYECSIIGIVLLTFLKSMFPYMDAWWYVALIASLTGLWFSLSYLKRHNYRWGFSYIENHLYIDLLLKVQKWFQNATIIALLIPVFLTELFALPKIIKYSISHNISSRKKFHRTKKQECPGRDKCISSGQHLLTE